MGTSPRPPGTPLPQERGVRDKGSAILFIILLFFSSPSAFAQTTPGRVLLTLDPPISKLIPFEAEAKRQQIPPRFHLEAQDSQGKALSHVRMQVKIVTPKTNPWISTDFPIVEGTELLNLDVPAAQGVVEFKQMLPIRGTYQVFVKVLSMDAQASPLIEKTASAPLIEQVLTVDVPENPIKFQNFAILAGICTLVGVLGGAFMGRSGGAEMLPESMRILLMGLTLIVIAALIFMNVSAEIPPDMPHMANHQDMSEPAVPHSLPPPSVRNVKQTVQLKGSAEAIVGEAQPFQAALIDRSTGKEISSAFEVSVINTENNWTLFSIATPIDRHLRWKQQFFDGSPHRIEIQTPPHNAQPALATSHSVSVEGIAPPVFVRLKALVYLTGFVALGLFGMLGLRLKFSRTGVSS